MTEYRKLWRELIADLLQFLGVEITEVNELA